MERIIYVFCVVESTTLIFFKEFRFQAMAILFRATGGVNSTLHRGHPSGATTANFSRRVHVAQDDRGILLNAVCVFLQNHTISFTFHRILFDPQVSSHFSTSFLHLRLVRVPLFRCCTRR